jgi:hypothetical protein
LALAGRRFLDQAQMVITVAILCLVLSQQLAVVGVVGVMLDLTQHQEHLEDLVEALVITIPEQQ